MLWLLTIVNDYCCLGTALSISFVSSWLMAFERRFNGVPYTWRWFRRLLAVCSHGRKDRLHVATRGDGHNEVSMCLVSWTQMKHLYSLEVVCVSACGNNLKTCSLAFQSLTTSVTTLVPFKRSRLPHYKLLIITSAFWASLELNLHYYSIGICYDGS